MSFGLGRNLITKPPLRRLFARLATRPKARSKINPVHKHHKLLCVASQPRISHMTKIPALAEALLPEPSPRLLALRLKDDFPRSILKPARSSHADGVVLSISKHGRHVLWGEDQVQYIKQVGFRKPPPRITQHKGLEIYMRRRMALQHVIVQDVEWYRDMLSSKPFSQEMSREEADKVCTATLASQIAGAETLSEVLIECNLPTNAVKLYNAYHTLLAVKKLPFYDRLDMHMFFAKVERSQEDRAYHADLIIEMITRALEIPSGPKNKHRRVINQAAEAGYLRKHLARAQEVLRADNEGYRLNVSWNRLPQGSEGQRIYMENSACTDNLASVRPEPEPMDVDDADVCSLARDMARLSVKVTEAFLGW